MAPSQSGTQGSPRAPWGRQAPYRLQQKAELPGLYGAAQVFALLLGPWASQSLPNCLLICKGDSHLLAGPPKQWNKT